MLSIAQFVATLSCAIFAGAAIYINLVEHPARMSCGTSVAATVWAPSYERATVMQASLAVVGFASGVAAWLLGGGMVWLVGACLLGLVVPYTFIVVLPINTRLQAPGRDLGSSETRALLETWGRLHAVRSVLSLAASAVFVAALLIYR
jgi:uncharacterized membrane protein